MGIQDDHRDFQHGLKGGSPLTANNAIAWAAGDAQRKLQESATLTGEEHPNAWQIFILAGAVAAVIGVLLDFKLVPALISASWWRVGGIWLVGTTAVYFGLKALPGWLSGTIMGGGLGAVAGAVGWAQLSPLWGIGLAIGVGGAMYFAFSSLK